jgi:hypothetical protein
MESWSFVGRTAWGKQYKHKEVGMKHTKVTICLGLFLVFMGFLAFPQAAKAQDNTIMWINHLDFLAGDPSVTTSFNAVNSGIGGGLSGLVITSTATGEDAVGGGNKVIEKGVQVPPWYLVTGVRVCYELTNPRSFISQIRLAQLQNPPGTAVVELDDVTDQKDIGPTCIDTVPAVQINPASGGLRLSLRVNFGDLNDSIVIRGVGLYFIPDPNSPMQKEIDALREAFENHTHIYLTGKGVGHNNTEAITSEPVDPSVPPPAPPSPPTHPPKKPKKK